MEMPTKSFFDKGSVKESMKDGYVCNVVPYDISISINSFKFKTYPNPNDAFCRKAIEVPALFELISILE